MTEFRMYRVPAEATHLIVVDSLRAVVSMIDLAAECPREVYVPKGDSLYWADEDGVRHYVDRPGVDEDLAVELGYLPSVVGPPGTVYFPPGVHVINQPIVHSVSIVEGESVPEDQRITLIEQDRAGGYQEGVTLDSVTYGDSAESGGSMRPSAEIMAGLIEGAKLPDRPDWSDRHASTQHIVKYFSYEHLKTGELRHVSQLFHSLMVELLNTVEDGPELSAGLRKLLEAKDCCVRAALPS